MSINSSEAAALNTHYGLNPPHSEVVEAVKTISPGDALDMGCGTGRNALFLAQLGFNVTAVDANPNAIDKLNAIVAREKLPNLSPKLYDINQAQLDGAYDFIACTVTLMFLDPGRVGAVLDNMQESTRPGGTNLIVCAMDTDAYPCPVNFPFTFGPDELRSIYQDWTFLKYNEDLGTMHNGARLQFATMLAKKTSP